MYLKYITNFNLKATPWFSNCDYSNWKSTIHEKMSNIIDNDNLIIYCVQETYGYRTGLFGLFGHTISSILPIETFFFRQIMNSNIRYYQSNNILSSDGEIISSFISKINRYIPFLNIGTWDYKNNLLLKNFFHENHSIPYMFDFHSPMLDSGCGIFSNKKPFLSGYEPLDFINKISLSDNLSSKGIIWSFFKNEYDKGITVISFNLSDDLFELSKLLELEQIMSMKNKLHNQFGLMVKEYETYIIGDFKINFNEETESFVKLTDRMFVNHNNTNYLIYQRENANENGTQMKNETQIKEETKENETQIKEETKENEQIKEEMKQTNIFNPLNNYFKSTPLSSPSSSSQSSGEWILI